MVQRFAIPSILSLLLCLIVSTTSAQINPPSGLPFTDNIPSMGRFKIVVEPAFVSVLNAASLGGYWNAGTRRLTSPVMFDGNTQVALSLVDAQGSGNDIAGLSVGSPSVGSVKESDYTLKPPGFSTGGTKQLATALHQLNMIYLNSAGAPHDSCTSCNALNVSGLWSVVAGAGNGLTPCPGEVQLHGATLASFFDVFVEVTIPGIGVVKNSTPLLVENDNLNNLPPDVVYIHKNTQAVAVYFKTSGSNGGGSWNANDLLGYLVLAGHGTDFQCSPAECQRFVTTSDNIFAATGEMPLPDHIPALTEWGLAVLGLFLLGTVLWLYLRKRTAPAL